MADIEIKKQLQIMFTVKDENNKSLFVDALYYPEDEIPKDDTINEEIQRRYDNHLDALKEAQNAPPLSEEKQLEDISNDIEILEAELDRLNLKQDELQNAVAEPIEDLDTIPKGN